MNFLPLFFAFTSVFCADGPYAFNNKLSEHVKVERFVKYHLHNLYRLSVLLESYSYESNSSSALPSDHLQSLVAPFSDFFHNVWPHFVMHRDARDFFLKMYNNSCPIARASPELVLVPIRAVFAWYSIELEEDKMTEEGVKDYLLSLYCRSYE